MSDKPMDLQQAISTLAASTDGILTTGIVLESDLERLDTAAAAGDERAPLFIDAMLGIVDYVQQAPADRPAICGGCMKPIRLPDLIGCGVIMPATPRIPGEHVAIALCRSCGATRPAAMAAVRAVLVRDNPDAEILDVAHGQVGHA